MLLVLTACAPLPAPAAVAEGQLATQTAAAIKAVEPTETASPPATHAMEAITAVNTGRLAEVDRFEVESPYRLSWSQDSRYLGALLPQGLVLWNTHERVVGSNVVVHSPVVLLDYSPDTLMMATTTDQTKIDLKHLLTGETLRSLINESPLITAFFSPQGDRLAVASTEKIAVNIWGVASGELLQTLSGFETAAPVYGALFSDDGQYLIWVSRGTVQVMEIASGDMGAVLGHEDSVTGVALVPGGKILAAATAGSVGGDFVPVVILWDAAGGEELGRLTLGGALVLSVAFSPDGSLLATGFDKEVVLWEVASRQMLARLSGHTEQINSVAFSPDGATLASASGDGSVRLWRVQR